MNYQLVIKEFPIDILTDIVDNNRINKAVGIDGNVDMNYLMTAWKVYIEPDLKVNCGLCYERVLNYWKTLQGLIIDIVKNSKLLDIA